MSKNALEADKGDGSHSESDTTTAADGDFLADLTAFQRDLLFAVAKRQASGQRDHGLGIREEMESRGYKLVQHGRLYPNLDDLVDMGLVEKSQQDLRTNSYALTRRGKRELVSRLRAERECVAGLDLPDFAGFTEE